MTIAQCLRSRNARVRYEAKLKRDMLARLSAEVQQAKAWWVG